MNPMNTTEQDYGVFYQEPKVRTAPPTPEPVEPEWEELDPRTLVPVPPRQGLTAEQQQYVQQHQAILREQAEGVERDIRREVEMLTEPQLGTRLASETEALDRAEASLRSARSTMWEAERAAEDLRGSLDDPALGARAVEDYLAPKRKALREAEQRVSRAAEVARRTVGAIERVTERRRVTLTDEEHTRAGARLPLVREQAATLPLRSIRDEILGAIQADDRAAMFVWLQQAGARIEAGNERDKNQEAEADDIRRLLRSVRSKIESQPLADLHGRAREAAKRARDLEGEATKRQRESQRFGFQSGRDVRW